MLPYLLVSTAESRRNKILFSAFWFWWPRLWFVWVSPSTEQVKHRKKKTESINFKIGLLTPRYEAWQRNERSLFRCSRLFDGRCFVPLWRFIAVDQHSTKVKDFFHFRHVSFSPPFYWNLFGHFSYFLLYRSSDIDRGTDRRCPVTHMALSRAIIISIASSNGYQFSLESLCLRKGRLLDVACVMCII